MTVSREGLYNIDDARALSFHLAGVKKFVEEEKPTPYIHFASKNQSGAAAPQVTISAESQAEEPAPNYPSDPFDKWETLLQWCAEITKSNAYFVVDPQGFILMRQGDESSDDGFEGAGANLQLAIDQLRQMQLDTDEVQMVDLSYQNKSMLVFRVKDKENDFFTLCFIGSSHITDAQKKVMYLQIQRSVMKLT